MTTPDDGGISGNFPSPATELLEIDIEKYEKSPKRKSSKHNDSSHHSPKLKMPRKKDINIEIDKLKCVELEDHDSYTDTEVIV